MKSLNSKRTIFFAVRTLAIVLVVIHATGCLTNPTPPNGGIRVEMFNGLATTTGLSLPPVPNAPNQGFIVPGSEFGQGTGFERAIAGFTNAMGYSDYPNARTAAVWDVIAGPTAIPPCGPGHAQEEVPTLGATFTFFCTP